MIDETRAEIRMGILREKLKEYERNLKRAESVLASNDAPNFAAWADVDRACIAAIRSLMDRSAVPARPETFAQLGAQVFNQAPAARPAGVDKLLAEQRPMDAETRAAVYSDVASLYADPAARPAGEAGTRYVDHLLDDPKWHTPDIRDDGRCYHCGQDADAHSAAPAPGKAEPAGEVGLDLISAAASEACESCGRGINGDPFVWEVFCRKLISAINKLVDRLRAELAEAKADNDRLSQSFMRRCEDNDKLRAALKEREADLDATTTGYEDWKSKLQAAEAALAASVRREALLRELTEAVVEWHHCIECACYADDDAMGCTCDDGEPLCDPKSGCLHCQAQDALNRDLTTIDARPDKETDNG